jgi:hypothetical protein
MLRKVLFLMLLAIILPAQLTWSAGRIQIGESGDSWIELGFLGQFHFVYSADADDQTDFFLRRGRIILSGQIMDGIKFFAETDNDNAGKGGGAAVGTDIQDAFADFRLFKVPIAEGWIKAGLILLPFSFENRSSAGSLLGIDYNLEVIKLVNAFVWRDYGVEFHGNVGRRFAYFLGAFDGYDEPGSKKNPDSALRYTGHLAFNILGQAETGWFFSQERLGKKGTYLSVGAGIDRQDKASLIVSEDPAVPNTIVNSEAWVFDVQSGFNIDPVSITANGAYYHWKNYAFEGETGFIEAGALYSRFMLTTKFSLQNPKSGESIQDYTAGLHYFIKDHNARVGLEYRWGDSPDTVLCGVQILL